MIESLGPLRFASPDAGSFLGPQRRETETPQNGIGIYNETDRLRRVALWGPVGAEAVLAQIYPADVSLFHDSMNVVKARDEAIRFRGVLESYDVVTHSIRDVLATEILDPVEKVTREQLISGLLAVAARIYGDHYYSDGKSKLDGKYPAGDGSKKLFDYTAPIATLVDLDIEAYGLERAVALNEHLCVNPEMPLGNSIYARDQMNVILGTRFISNMAKPIRQKEVPMYERAYRHLGLPQGIELSVGETFEGGDAYIHNNTVYVGVGPRTTLGAAITMYDALKPQLDSLGMRFAIVEDPDPKNRPERDKMDFMHLDTFSASIGDGEAVVCGEEGQRRRVRYLETRAGQTVITDSGRNFVEHLRDTNPTVLIIPKEEQQNFGTNFLALDNQTILLPFDTNPVTNQRLQAAGKTLVFLGLTESTKGYGASHCMTGQLRRAA